MRRTCSTSGAIQKCIQSYSGKPLGKPRRKWEDNVKMDLMDVGFDTRNWMELSQDRNKFELM